MGGGPRYNYPKFVWSPAGGWWPEPKSWRSNTRLAAVVGVGLALPVMYFSSRRERRPVPPVRRIPSQSLAKHAKKDDPSI